MTVTTHGEPRATDRLVVHAAGELDLATCAELRRSLDHTPAHPDAQFVVDVSAVTFIDCSGLQPLLEARNRWGNRMALRGPARPVTRLLDLADLNGLFEVQPT